MTLEFWAGVPLAGFGGPPLPDRVVGRRPARFTPLGPGRVTQRPEATHHEMQGRSR